MNKTHISIILSLLFFSLMAACTYTQKIRDGRTAFERKQYAVAVKMLNKEYNKAKTRVEKGKIAFLLAESYKNLNQSENSINWYETAYNNQFGIDALKEYAYALKKAERYKEAQLAFKDLGIEIGSPYEYRREINACEFALGWKQIENKEYFVDLLDFNSGFADYAPTIYKDNQLVFTSDRKVSTGDDTYNWTGNKFSDLFVVDLKSNDITSFDQGINSTDNEGTVAFNKDFSEVYFTRCYGGKLEDAYCKIMVSKVEGGSWSTPEVLGFVEDNINYGHPTLSKDGKKLFFSCNHPDGWGGYDIYMVERTDEGWSEPDLLGRSINSPGNEQFPYLDADTLYFSSDFHTGMGGLDIFKSFQFSNGTWSPAINLKPPINSGGDDFGFAVNYEAIQGDDVLAIGYFTSTRDEGLGNDDIYRFEKRIPPPEPEKPVEEEIVYKMILDGYVLEKIYEEPGNPNSRVLGRKPLPGSTVEIKIGKNKKPQTVTVGEDGLFTLELDEETDYSFLGSKQDYLNNQAVFSTKGIGKDPSNPVLRYEVEIVLDKIFLNQEITLENIYYDFDKWDIRDDAKPTLDVLANNLRLNPKIRIQMGSHTDCRGNTRYNENLSQKRAQSAVEYLILKGIDASRLQAKGFGESVPSADCACARCSEDEHQQNRRTTFSITEN